MTSSRKTILLSITLVLGTLLSIVSTFHFRQDDIAPATAIASLPPVSVEKKVDEKPGFYFHSLVEGELKSGDSLSRSLNRCNISATVRQQVVSNLSSCLDFRRLRPNDKYRIYLDDKGGLLRCEYESGPLDSYSVTKNDDNFITKKDAVDLEVKAYMAEGQISTSLFDAFAKQNIKAPVIFAFADIFSSRIDFNTEIRKGDSFKVVFEKYFKSGQFVGFGNILYAQYKQQNGHSFEGHFFTPEGALGAFFDSEGRELGTSFLKSPVPMGRVTSSFTWRRKHPILGVVRPHLGIDLAAPIGTPVMAAADGKVIFIGRKGGFGRQVILSHPGGYKTHYGHLSRFPKGLKKGDIVTQKQIIGYVGSSGLSTGPHLDYRLQHHKQFLNPFAMNFKPKSVLKGDDLARFQSKITGLSRLIDSISSPDVLFVRHLQVQPDERLTLL